jgi:hypothetical protein
MSDHHWTVSIHRRRWTCWLFSIALLAAPEAQPNLAQTAPAALWTGQVQCQLAMKTDGYAHQEVQTWIITGQPKQQGAVAVYPATWIGKGEGAMLRAQGTQTMAAKWSSNVPPIGAPIGLLVRASDNRLIIKSWHLPLSVPGAVTGVRQMSVGTASPTQSILAVSATEWPFPDVEDDASSTNVSGSGTVVVFGNLLPMQSASAKGTANCKWQFSKGGAPSPGLQLTSPGPAILNTSPQPGIPREQQPPSTRGMTSTSSSQNQAGDAPSMNPPTPTPASGSIKLQWTAPTSTGGAVDSYGIDVDSGNGTKQQTIAAPATTATLAVAACPYPNQTCQSPKTLRFRVRAHSSAGYGPYSDYTQWVRPLTSYAGDNVNSIWAAKQCASCHGQSSRLNLSGTAAQSYASIVNANIISTPTTNSLLLTCPTGNGLCGGNHTSHPGGELFGQNSIEFWLILQWLNDGRLE